MSTDANSLLAQAKCYLCLGVTMAEALQLALLAQIATGGASGTNAQQTYTSLAADPNAAGIVPVNGNIGNWFYQDPAVGTGTNVWEWSVTKQNWSQFSV